MSVRISKRGLFTLIPERRVELVDLILTLSKGTHVGGVLFVKGDSVEKLPRGRLCISEMNDFRPLIRIRRLHGGVEFNKPGAVTNNGLGELEIVLALLAKPA
mgnify:CR=1 FL=1